jgi:hypothetical protein
MFTSRYSELEMQQWHDACAACGDSQNAGAQTGARASMAKGEAEKKQSRAATAPMQTQNPKHEDWAGECLFDCYNG